MSHTQVGTCPQCGAPLYQPTTWGGITPPPVEYSCMCNAPKEPQIKITNTTTEETQS